jgi:serine/threonine protein phosphatase 1
LKHGGIKWLTNIRGLPVIRWTLERLKLKDMKTFVVGDIHGGFKALKQVLMDSGFDYENDKLISLGDLADGWSETHLVIEELLKIKNLILLRGNHDEWALNALSTRYQEDLLIEDREALKVSEKWIKNSFYKMSGSGRTWYAHGGLATEASYEAHPELIAKHIKFLDSALDYYVDSENRLFAHAGPDPYCEILEETEPSQFYWNRNFWSKAWSGHHPGRQWKEVYIGHTPTISMTSNKIDVKKPINRRNVWNMDTGACFTGRLSLMNIDTKELYQSELVMKLYPNEKGRNYRTYNECL